MTSKIPWATALILIVAAVAVGTWAVWGTAPAEQPPITPPPTPQAGTVTVLSSNILFAGSVPSYSGLENLYIMRWGDGSLDDNLENLGGWDAIHENVAEYQGTSAILTGTGLTVNVPYDNLFYIVVGFKVDNDNVANVGALDNFYVNLDMAGTYTDNDNTTSENMFALENGSPDTDWVRYNAVFTNRGNGYTLSAGQSITITRLELYGWG